MLGEVEENMFSGINYASEYGHNIFYNAYIKFGATCLVLYQALEFQNIEPLFVSLCVRL